MAGKAKKSFWTSLPGILTGLAALIGSITGLYLALGDRQKVEPELPIHKTGIDTIRQKIVSEPPTHVTVTDTIRPGDNAITLDQEVSRKQAADLLTRFIAAYEGNRVSTILAMTDAPFYFGGGGGVFLDRSERISEKIGPPLGAKKAKLRVLRSTNVRTIGRFRREATASQLVNANGNSFTSIIQTLGLGDDDFVLEFDFTTQKNLTRTLWLFTRVKNGALVLAGMTEPLVRQL